MRPPPQKTDLRAGGPGLRAAALSHFGRLISSLREEQGYPTARGFYDSQGGQAEFGCTLRAYVNVEKGRSAPQPPLAERIAAALRLALDSERAKSFAAAYLRVLLGFGDFYAFAFSTLGHEAGAPQTAPAVPAARRRARVLTASEAKLLRATPAGYGCYALLANDSGRWTAEALSSRLELPMPEISASLARLESAGLLSRDAKGRYACSSPARTEGLPSSEELRELGGRWDDLGRKEGKVLLDTPLLFRASESELTGYYPHLLEAVDSAESLSVLEPGPDTALFLVETRVVKLLPF